MKNRGFSVLEVLTAAGLLTVVTLVALVALRQTVKVWHNVSSRDQASLQLRRAALRLERDAGLASLSSSDQMPAPASLPGGGSDGDAFWFLTPVGADGEIYQMADGSPFWQRQILYYLTVPQGVDALAGGPVTAGADADGYEDRCPYKLLIRKVIDIGPTADLADETTVETLLSDPSPYLTRPNGTEVGFMLSEPGVDEVEIVANHLLQFRVGRGVDHIRELEFDLRAVRISEARREVGLGPVSLAESAFTLQNLVSVIAHH